MKLLIVDDQPGVVHGLLSGIDWDSAGFDSVYTAYNALEARAILCKEGADVLLCDIEMPVEDGLQLLRWMQDEGYETRCILLTSHAEFAYAQKAVQLGVFDYIIQPAPYAEVLRVVKKAAEDILGAAERSLIYQRGKMFKEQEQTILAKLQQDFLLGDPDGDYLNMLQRLDVLSVNDTPCYLLLLQIVRWYELEARWDGPLMAKALDNILNEIFAVHNCKTATCFMEANTFGIIVQQQKQPPFTGDELMRQMLYFNSICEQYLKCSIACYTGKPLPIRDMPKQWTRLTEMRNANVALKSGSFFEDYTHEPFQEYKMAQIKHWATLLTEGYSQTMEDEACGLLDQMVQNGSLSPDTLYLFYREFMWMLYSTARDTRNLLNELFQDQVALEHYRNGMKSVDMMKQLICYVSAKYRHRHSETPMQATLVRQVIDYINSHLECELRREELAGKVHVSPDYLTRIFKKETGLTLREYITEQKMREAQSLLRTTTLPISFVAAKVGYSNFSHFSFTYKKAMGITPQEERKS